jgi:hypothetical protein
MLIFTIVDRVSGKAGNLFCADNIEEGKRLFYDTLAHAQEGTLFSTHPDDFNLYSLATFDAKEVEIVNPESVLVAKGEDRLKLSSEGVAA